MNFTDTATLVERTLEAGGGLWVELDAGHFDLYGADLRETWDDLAPGESFSVLGVLIGDAALDKLSESQ